MRRIKKTAWLFSAGLLLLCMPGCGRVNRLQEQDEDPFYSSYRDIPGVTGEEIAAIETLREQKSRFVYGMNLTTETFYDADGKIDGYTALFCDWLTNLFGIPFEPAIYEWDALIAGLESREIDFTGELTATEERRKIYYMSDAIAERSIKFMRIAGSEELLDIAKFRPLRYAFLEGTTTYDQIALLERNSFEEVFIGDYDIAYRMLKSGEIDAFFDEGIAEAAFDIYGDVVAEDFLPLTYGPVSLTTQNPDSAPVIAVIQKALRSGAARQLISMYHQGHQNYLRHKLFSRLTREEQVYIRGRMRLNLPILVAAEYDNYPASFYNDQEREWQGISFDVLEEISALTGLTFSAANSNLVEWPELLDMLERGEAVMLSELIRSQERENRFLWPESSYQTDYYALLSRTEYKDVNINEVLYSRVGLIKDSAYAEVFRTWFPHHPGTVEYMNTGEAFDALERGETDLVMATRNLLLSLTNFAERPGFKANLVFKEPFESTFGFNAREIVLCSIVSKAQKLIDMQSISDRWTRRVFDYRGKMAQAQVPWLIGASGLMLCLFALILVMFLRRGQERKKLELTVRERTAELVRQDRLLHAVNDMADLLLASDTDNFKDALRRGMEMMARGVDVDRIYIWKNQIKGGILYYVQIFEWLDKEAALRQDTVQAGMESPYEFPYIASIPEWEHKFSEGETVKGPLRRLSPREQERLAPYGIKSILVIPVFLQDEFWGFVSFDDCHREREFSKDEEGILRSGSLLLANALVRDETTRMLRNELSWQEVLASAALNMAAPLGFNDNVNNMLQAVGRFMGVDAFGIFEAYPEEQYFECTFEWVKNADVPRRLGSRISCSGENGGAASGYGMIPTAPFIAVSDLREFDPSVFAEARGAGMISFFNLPLHVEGKFWGFMGLSSMRQSFVWGDGEVNFLKTVGAILGRSIENYIIRRNLSNSAARFEAVVNNYSGVIWSINKDRIIESFNGLYLNVLGVTPAFLVGKPLGIALTKNRHLDIIERVEKTFAEGPQAWNSDIDGKVFSVHTVPIVDEKGETTAVVGDCIEITQMITMQKELERSIEEARAASRAKSDFLSNMSHEMRTPMNAIIGMTSIAKTSTDIERKDYCLDKIEDASVHLLGVINDILDMSKIEANRFELSFVEFDFEKTLQKVANIINFRVDEKAQNFTVHIDRNIPRYVIGDDQRLAQVITNLLGNAVKFTPERGSITLKVSLAKEEDGVCTIRIDVSDTGIGISQEQQSRLFTSFEQAESTTSRKFGGTGLGLAISKRIVELMGGTIWIESEPGKGSTFAFTVQVKRGQGTRQSLLNPGVDWKNIRIIAVDDDPGIRDYLKEILLGFGVNCDIAASGEEAVELIERTGPYDVYLVDWKMPGMDGIELSRKIKEGGAGKSVIIMISATEWNVIEADAKSAGVDKFLSKPLFPSSIADCINECMGMDNLLTGNKSQNDTVDSFEGYRVLLAEDVEINREIVMALLEPTLLTIDCAENGVEALKMFSAAPDIYDMIFMDVQMPEMDGYEATRRIRALDIPEAKQVPIVAMTANVFREDIEKCIRIGMNGHVGKPLDFDDVLVALRKYLPSKRKISSRSRTAAPQDAGGGTAGASPENPLPETPPVSKAGMSEWKYGVAWNAELETGNEEIDTQHRQLFKLTSDLVDACTSGRGSSVLGEALDFLAAYTLKHFGDEEALQLKYHYPGYEEHKKLHDDFKQTALTLIAEYKESGSSADLSNKVYSVIVRWLVAHIKGEDSKIAAFIRESERAASK